MKTRTPVVALVLVCIIASCWATGQVTTPAVVVRSDISDDVGPGQSALGPLDFAIIIDCGSSQTSMFLFQWPERRSTTTLASVQWLEMVSGSKQSTLIMSDESMLYMPRNKVIDLMTKFLDKGEEMIPSQRHSRTIVFVKCTGLLVQLRRSELIFLLNDVRDVAGSYPFEFHWSWASVLSGLDTAVFNWISVNYLKKYLQNRAQEVGSVSLGAGSLRIAYQQLPDYGSLQHKQGGYNITLAGDRYELYARGDVRMGHTAMYTTVKDAAVLLALDSGMVNENGTAIVNFPCFNPGCHQEHTFRGSTYVLVGTGSFEQCGKIIRDNLDIAGLNPADTKLPGVDALPPFDNRVFYASGAMYHVAQAAGLTGLQSMEDWKAASDTYCRSTWASVLTETNDPPMEEYTRVRCFGLAATFQILHEGMKIPLGTKQVQFTLYVDGHSTEWMLGSVLYYADLQPLDVEVLLVEQNSGDWATYIFLGLTTFVVITIALILSIVVRKVIHLNRMDMRAVSYFDSNYQVDVQAVDPLMDPIDPNDKAYS